MGKTRRSQHFGQALPWDLDNGVIQRFAAQVDHRLLKADSHIACRAHAVPLPCRAAKSLECVFPI